MKYVFIICFVLIQISLFGQKGFKVIETKESLEFSGKIKFGKDNQHLLFLKIKNTSTSDVGVNFKLGLYWEAQIVSESESTHICVRAGKSKKGRSSNLVFPLYEFTKDQLQQNDFKVEITAFEATRLSKCK